MAGSPVKEKKTRSSAPEFLAELLDHSTHVLTESGLDKEQARLIARNISKRMCETWGGQLIYFPYWLREELSERDRKIYDEFNGSNHQELSRKHHMSLQAIYRIVNYVRAEEIAKRQTTLGFD